MSKSTLLGLGIRTDLAQYSFILARARLSQKHRCKTLTLIGFKVLETQLCARFRAANDSELLLELGSLLAEKPERLSIERVSSIKVLFNRWDDASEIHGGVAVCHIALAPCWGPFEVRPALRVANVVLGSPRLTNATQAAREAANRGGCQHSTRNVDQTAAP